MATGPGEGLPVKLHLGTKVMACDSEAGRISLINGEVLHADLVLGADGVHVRVIFFFLYATNKSSSPSFVLTY